jgi:NYN domain
MSNSEKIALFIDGQHLHHATKSLGFGVDFKRLLFEFQKRGTIVRSYYYITISENADCSVRSRRAH